LTTFSFVSLSDTHNFEEEACLDWKDSITIQVDFSLAVFFVVYFFIRFLAADDKLAFVLSIESLVDYFTVPPIFLSGTLKKNLFS
jgi:potassium large conductance calcium-activated channel subfamily M alpha protein 1